MKISLFFHSVNAAAQLVLDYDRPVLNGSEKQVKWADDIRSLFEKEIIQGVLRISGVTVGCWLQDDNVSEQLQTMNNAFNVMAGPKPYGEWFEKLLAHKEAKFWIDNRDVMLTKLLMEN